MQINYLGIHCRRANYLYSFFFAASCLLQSQKLAEATDKPSVCSWYSLCSIVGSRINYDTICEEPWKIFTSCWTNILLESNI